MVGGGATGYESELLAGFDVPRYDVDAAVAFAAAKQEMAAGDRARLPGRHRRRRAARRDHGHPTTRDVLFRLLLLPLWIATYVVAGKTYRVYVNANTGKVIGERPYSAAKITAAVLAALVTLVAAYLLYRAHGG